MPSCDMNIQHGFVFVGKSLDMQKTVTIVNANNVDVTIASYCTVIKLSI